MGFGKEACSREIISKKEKNNKLDFLLQDNPYPKSHIRSEMVDIHNPNTNDLFIRHWF